jgi:hypothetical protein
MAKKTTTSSKRAPGRPLKLLADDQTIATVSGLAKIQCTHREAAAVLGVARETFEKFLGREEKARAAWENGQQSGLASLRRRQFAMAETNAAMAIWLGKQYLGQKDHAAHEHHMDASQAFLQLFKAISDGHGAKLIEAHPAH